MTDHFKPLRGKRILIAHADVEGPNQTALLISLIRAFVICLEICLIVELYRLIIILTVVSNWTARIVQVNLILPWENMPCGMNSHVVVHFKGNHIPSGETTNCFCLPSEKTIKVKNVHLYFWV